ncbi:MAG: efflux RND transporter periplasmic adaptor subunit, partial [Cycloclasticus sp.]|nr:efflux RND transporter periplasmic adaptor subunit [Cycloclasticus sp.]
DVRTFPAEVDAIQKADISFRVSGKIKKILVKEGDDVKKGQILAELDPTDFEITLKDRKASYTTAKANYDRAQTLVKKGAISKADRDNLRAKYHTAKASLASAEQDLTYTKLRANFDGQIAKRYAENHEEVVLSKKIFALEDLSSLKVIIDLPENLMIAINKKNARTLYAEFVTIKNQQFPLTFREASTKADPSTKTFKVTLQMPAAEKFNILPGMTATVYAEMSDNEININAPTTLPVSAVIADNMKQATVWVVDEESMTVNPKKVTPGIMTGNNIQVQGLEPGERIVIAGVPFLRKNMKVTLLNTGEQPK